MSNKVKTAKTVCSRATLLASTIAVALLGNGSALAADVPAGVELAEDQSIIRHIKAEPASLDPHRVEGLPGGQVVRDLFEGLVSQNAKGEIVPGVAERWQTEDNKVFTFYLREDARWSNGDPVTADDFVYSLRRVIDPNTASPYAWFVEIAQIENAEQILTGDMAVDKLGVRATDSRTLEITLAQPLPYFVSLMAHFTMYPVHQATVEQYGDKWTEPGTLVGNGAYQLTNRVVNEKLVLEQNPSYWDHENSVIEQVVFLPISSETSALQRYRAGEVHITESFPKEHYQTLLKQIPDEVKVPPQLGTYYYAFNMTKPPLDDVRIRKALSFAIDRELIASKVIGTGETPAYNFTPDIVNGFAPQPNLLATKPQAELDKLAAELIAEAGYGKDKPLTVELLYNTSETHKKVALAVASMWKQKLGVEVTMVNQEWKTYLSTRSMGNFEVARSSWIGDYNEASTFLDLMTTTHGSNYSQFSNERYDELMAESKTVVDLDKRAELYNEAEQIIAEYAPIAPIYQYTNGRLIKPWVKGYPIDNPEDVAYSHNLYIVKH